MPIRPFALLSIALLSCLPWLAHAQSRGFLRTDGTRIVDADGKPVVWRGMGLGGWMLQEGYMLELPRLGTQRVIRQHIAALIGEEKTQAFYTAWLDHHTTKSDVDAMGAWGFNTIRLPMHYALYTLPVDQEPVKGRQTWIEEGFRRTDQLIAWAKANDMTVILDLHAAPGGQGNDLNIADRDPSRPSLWDDPAAQDKMVALWVELARRYRDQPAVAAYDLLNEPNWGFADAADKHGCREQDNAPLRALLERTTKAIRAVDTRHIVVIEGNCWGNNYAGLLDGGLWDDNLVLSFHKYWDVPSHESIAKVLALRDEHHVPLWLGETGENSNDWFTRTVALVEGEGIGWSWWPLKKIRYNNPLQVVPNPGYKKLLAYWNDKGPKPSAAEAEAALMQLATHDVQFDNNVQHADVVDALLQAPHSAQSRPFKAHAVGLDGGRIAATDFDMGPNGVAYGSPTPANESTKPGGAVWNTAMTYRNDGVDLGKRPNGTLYVRQLREGAWLKYSVNVTQGGRYDLTLDATGNGQAALLLNGVAMQGQHADAVFRDLPLQPGRNTLVVKAERGALDLTALRFDPGD
jgi:endoglucanase